MAHKVIVDEFEVLRGWRLIYSRQSSPKNDLKLKHVEQRIKELRTQALLLGIHLEE